MRLIHIIVNHVKPGILIATDNQDMVNVAVCYQIKKKLHLINRDTDKASQKELLK